MSEEKDRESQTEEPTEKRIADAVDKGNIPVAREATLLGSIAAIFAALNMLGGWFLTTLTDTLRTAFTGAGAMHIDDREAAATYLMTLVRDIGVPLLSIMAVIATGPILASLLQNVPSMSSERIAPKASRISPAAGWNRLFGKMGLIEFVKAFAKLGAVSVILWILFKRDLSQFAAILATSPILILGC